MYRTLYADPPWRFTHRTGKSAPEHGRLFRYETLSNAEIARIRVPLAEHAHCYLWVPMALIPVGLEVLAAWGFTYKTSLIWEKITKAGLPDARGMGFYFRTVTECLLFGVKGTLRTRESGRRQINLFRAPATGHSRKPVTVYDAIEACSYPHYLELFATQPRRGWSQVGAQLPVCGPAWHPGGEIMGGQVRVYGWELAIDPGAPEARP